jgi:hypothetical protein
MTKEVFRFSCPQLYCCTGAIFRLVILHHR